VNNAKTCKTETEFEKLIFSELRHPDVFFVVPRWVIAFQSRTETSANFRIAFIKLNESHIVLQLNFRPQIHSAPISIQLQLKTHSCIVPGQTLGAIKLSLDTLVEDICAKKNTEHSALRKQLTWRRRVFCWAAAPGP